MQNLSMETAIPDLLLNSQGEPHSVFIQHHLKLVVWTVSPDPSMDVWGEGGGGGSSRTLSLSIL